MPPETPDEYTDEQLAELEQPVPEDEFMAGETADADDTIDNTEHDDGEQ